MARYVVTHDVTIVDVNGDQAKTTFRSSHTDTTTLATIAGLNSTFATDVIACSNGKVVERTFSVLLDKAQLVIGTTPPTDAKYPSVTDGARLQFANNIGERLSLTVPAPLESDFGTGSMVVNPSDPNITALITFITGNAADAAGTLFNLYKGGIKTGRRARRRRNALVP